MKAVFELIQSEHLSSFLMVRSRRPDSHKGENGKVLVVGGGELFHGAPVLAALGAEKSGVDLVFLLVPRSQISHARNYSLNLIAQGFATEFLSGRDIKKLLDWSQKVDVCVVGNGLSEKPQSFRAVRELLKRSMCSKFILDGGALQPEILDKVSFPGKDIVITPHAGEWQRISGGMEPTEVNLLRYAKKHSCTVLLKGPEDSVVSVTGEVHRNVTGHSVMTKGGTGDVLAGIIGGFMAQGMSGFEAACEAARVWGKVGEAVFQRKGLMLDILDLLEGYPPVSV